jgi:hypothetical protein
MALQARERAIPRQRCWTSQDFDGALSTETVTLPFVSLCGILGATPTLLAGSRAWAHSPVSAR